jgi:RNA polymerase sigma-70 factor, ECF subfamily
MRAELHDYGIAGCDAAARAVAGRRPGGGRPLLEATYDELRRLARAFMRGERTGHTLQPTALLHEAYLRLFRDAPVDLASREAFFRLVGAQMRRQLVDHARRRGAGKRGAGLQRAEFDEALGVAPAATGRDEAQFARLDAAL